MDPDILTMLRERDEALADIAGGFGLKQLATNGLFSLRTKRAVVDTDKIDTKKLIVPGTLTTQDEDRSRDIVYTAGIDLEDHKSNPMVLFEHGFSDLGTRAIAQAEDEENKYQVTHEKGRLRSYSHFSAKFEASEQIFELYAEGLLRGLSIGIIPTKMEYRRDTDAAKNPGWPGMLIATCKLFEYSFCSIPDNPKALADRVLGKGKLASRPIGEALLKSLLPHLPAPSVQVVGGYTPPEPEKVEKTMTTPITPEPVAPVAAVAPPAPAPVVPVAALPPTPVHKNGNGQPHLEPLLFDRLPDRPVGAMVAEGVYDRLYDIADFVAKAASRHENPRLAVILDSVAIAVEEQNTYLCSFHQAEYPELEPFEPVVDPDEEPSEPGQANPRLTANVARMVLRLEALRKARATVPVTHKRMTKYACGVCNKASSFLDEVAEHPSLSETHKSAAMHHSDKLKSLTQSDQDDNVDADDSAAMKVLKVENDDLRSKVAELVKQHKQLAAAFRKAKVGQ